MLLFYDRPPAANGIPPPAGPLARAEGILELRAGCVWLRMAGDNVPLIFETGSVTLWDDKALRRSNGEMIAFGSKVEVAGASVGDGQGRYPVSRIESACGTRRGLLVTGDSLRRLSG